MLVELLLAVLAIVAVPLLVLYLGDRETGPRCRGGRPAVRLQSDGSYICAACLEIKIDT